MPSAVAVDSCVLIEFFRLKDKSAALYPRLSLNYDKLYISSVVLYEVRAGLTETNRPDWERLLENLDILPFDRTAAEFAADLSIRLRKNRIQLESSDLFIAATALANALPLATLNRKHFERIDGLKLIDIERDQP